MRVAVVGAGVAGLTCAYRLAQAGHQADVYERWPGLGGQAATLDVGGGALLERYYHHLFTSDRHIAGLFDELGMGDALRWHPSTVAFFVDGALWPFVSPLDLLRFKPLPPPARIRMGLVVLALQRFGHDVADYEQVTARHWIEDRMGRHAWQKVWGPLLRGKFGDRAEDISMAWLWSKLRLRRQVKGEEARQELLGYPGASWEGLLGRLRDEIERRGGRVLVDRPAARLDRDADGRLTVQAGAASSFRAGLDPRAFEPAPEPPEPYDVVVATVASDIFTSLLSPSLAGEVGGRYLGLLERHEYHAALCLLLELDRRFSPFYWTNIGDDAIPFVGLIEHTNLVDPAHYGGRRFLYVANYVARDDPLLALDADALLDRYEDGLRRVNPAWDRAWVRARWLHREPHAQPIVTRGYPARIPPLRTPAPGLLLANTTQIYPEDRGTNYAVRLGDRVAAEVLGTRTAAPTLTGTR